jgi:hypothetical protein
VKQANLKAMTIDQLVNRFAASGIEQDKAILNEKISEFPSLFGQMRAIDRELGRRGRQARLALCKLYAHPNMQVRLQAAKLTLGVAPTKARRVIESIAQSNWMPQAGDAGMCLWNLDNGVFKPD